MPEALSDTGPILHLQEIGRLPLLTTVSPLSIPELDGKVDRNDLERCVDDLFERSTLHLSRGFRAYIRQLLRELP